jgi:LmbE family N-acetylglucosaminyl deacetylase
VAPTEHDPAPANALLLPLPEDWTTGLVVVAHPDDLEYGAASAVARWTTQGKDIRYVLVTRGEAGIDGMEPERAAQVRTDEEISSAARVGVSVVEFLGHPDGLVVPSLALREDVAIAIRRHRPEVVIASNYRDRWGGGGPFNHADHRAVGIAVIDAVRDAANRWLFRDRGPGPWAGVRMVCFDSSPAPTHAVDIGGFLAAGIASLQEHRTYLDALGGDFDPAGFLTANAERSGRLAGVEYAVVMEVIPT